MRAQFSNGYALLVAVDDSQMPNLALPDVRKDAEAVQRVLTDPQRCAYPEDQVRLLAGEDATRAKILDGLAWLGDRLRADASGNATAVIYYSGHGWRDLKADPERYYLVPYDVREGQIRSRALQAEDVAEAVGVLQPQRLLAIFDCCHAGGMAVKQEILPNGYAAAAFRPEALIGGEREQGTSGSKAPGEENLTGLAAGQGRAVLSSSSAGQSSYVRRDRQMSIFTYHLVEALLGHAQPEEGATEVLVSDIMSHVTRRVPASAQTDWGRSQTPDYQVRGNFAVALLLAGQPWRKAAAAPSPEEVLGPVAALGGIHIDSGGGAVIGGDVQINHGEFVGRDKRTARD